MSCSDVRYEIFYILAITIIAHQIYDDTIIIRTYNSSPVWMVAIVEPQWLNVDKLTNTLYYKIILLVNGPK